MWKPILKRSFTVHTGRTGAEAFHNPTKAESSYLLEPHGMKAMSLQPHQNDVRAWRDEKIKQKGAKAGDLVSL
jgi:hypothetical protein